LEWGGGTLHCTLVELFADDIDGARLLVLNPRLWALPCLKDGNISHRMASIGGEEAPWTHFELSCFDRRTGSRSDGAGNHKNLLHLLGAMHILPSTRKPAAAPALPRSTLSTTLEPTTSQPKKTRDSGAALCPVPTWLNASTQSLMILCGSLPCFSALFSLGPCTPENWRPVSSGVRPAGRGDGRHTTSAADRIICGLASDRFRHAS